MDETAQRLRLRDGRWLGYAQYGDPKGKPVLYFHGWPGSRLEAQFLDPSAEELKLRVIALDRPGIGLSDFQPGRRIVDWPSDVCELGTALQLPQWAVVGVSGGGPYATVCAAKIPERLTTVALVCGLGPLDAPGATRDMIWLNRGLLFLARRAPRLGRFLLSSVMRKGQKHADHFLPHGVTAMFPRPDQLALNCPRLRTALIEGMGEAFRQGVQGPFYEGCLYVRPWEFRLEDITTEIFLWQGELDVHVPPSMGRHLANVLPRCHATFYANEGHLSLPLNRLPEILEAFVA
jgi:pimeloyl-ACP methyl ester carboxylesterase